jgi:hypothetical protein
LLRPIHRLCLFIHSTSTVFLAILVQVTDSSGIRR